jgi:hypothetical protein
MMIPAKDLERGHLPKNKTLNTMRKFCSPTEIEIVHHSFPSQDMSHLIQSSSNMNKRERPKIVEFQ